MEQVEEKTIVRNRIDYSEIKKWNVIFHNDDTTTMDFVVSVLMELFNHTEETAGEITLKIHTEGKCVVGKYIYEIAQQKASDTLSVASAYGFPLNVTIEKDE